MHALLRGPAPVLFACLFAAQASFLTLSPILPEVADDLGVGISLAGQLQALASVAGAAAALAVTLRGARTRPERLLRRGLLAIAGGAVLAAAAPGFAVLIAAEATLGAGMATVMAAGVGAGAAWTTEEDRASVLGWALLGQPAAWVVGMPVVGAVAQVSWRLAWLALPLAAALVALALLRRRPGGSPAALRGGCAAWRRREVRAWALYELLSQSAWAGTLVYAGALLHEVYGLGLGSVGALLALVAAAYFPGSLLAQRVVSRHARALALSLGASAGAGVWVLGALQASAAFTVALLALLMATVGARGLASSVLGLQTAPERAAEISGMRSVTQQVGGLVGAGAGGLALALAGWAGWGVVLGSLFVLGALRLATSADREGVQPLGLLDRDLDVVHAGARRA